MPHSMVLGANGQDGSYLVDCLLNRGHHVVGIGRRPRPFYEVDHVRFQYVSIDVGVPNALAERDGCTWGFFPFGPGPRPNNDPGPWGRFRGIIQVFPEPALRNYQ